MFAITFILDAQNPKPVTLVCRNKKAAKAWFAQNTGQKWPIAWVERDQTGICDSGGAEIFPLSRDFTAGHIILSWL